jgi:hypothetical protein
MNNMPMIPKSLHLPGWMDEELRMLAFISKMSKEELMRRMINSGLTEAWKEFGQSETLSTLSNPLPTRDTISEEAQAAFTARAKA